MYIGNSLQVAFPTYKVIDDISGSFNGSTTSFALLVSGTAPVPLPLNSQQCLISVGGVIQRPDDTGSEGFRLSGGNIVFSSAPSTGEDFFGVILAGADYVNVGANFPDGSVGVPSITFEQDSDTGFYRSGSGAVSFSSNAVQTAILGSNSLTAPSFIPTSSTIPANGVYLPAANSVGISTNSNERLRINSSGNVGIGTATPAYSLDIVGDLRVTNSSGGTIIANRTSNPGSVVFQHSGTETGQIAAVSGGGLNFYTGSTPTLKATLDNSGRLLVGTSSTSIGCRQVLEGSSGGLQAGIQILAANTGSPADSSALGAIYFADNSHASGTGLGADIFARRDGGTWTSGTSHPTRLVFSTAANGASSPTERMRIRNDGLIMTYSTAGGQVVNVSAGGGTSTFIYAGNRSSTDTQGSGGTTVYYVYSNGNVQNTNGSYTTLSDAKLKENIVDAGSQWNDLKAIQIRNWNFKAETGHETHRQIGPIAQELETVCPGLVFETPDRDEDGNETGEVTKGVNQSVLYMKAVKALQEAMERIEQLEAKVVALESKP